MMKLSESTTKLINRQSTLMELPNEQVGNVLRELIEYIAQNTNMVEALSKDVPPDPKQPLALDPQKVVRKMVENPQSIPSSGQRYFLQQVMTWIYKVQ
jgi:hypothetical protein